MLLLSTPLQAENDSKFFESRIGAVLVAKCVTCHRRENAKGGLDLTTRETILRGGDSRVGIVPGKPEESPILSRSIATNGLPPEMPEKGEPLTDKEASDLREWIKKGAPWPEETVLKEAPKADSSFWSVQPVQKFAPPTVPDAPTAWQVNPIDRFVWQKLNAKGLQPSELADARTFIRRATFDLLGLPPTPDEVAAFERECRAANEMPRHGTDDLPVDSGDELRNDPDLVTTYPTAQTAARLIDRLLQSPHYGERWARHWLDIAHYADTHGFERDQVRPNAWRYRDYVIQSFNTDKPYDQFLREQIAGDVLAPDDPQSVIATGFLAAGPWDFVGQVETKSDLLKRAARAGDLDDMVTQVITSSMGLTINCARCHDHKLDPISQAEYYRLWAVFAGVKRGEREVNSSEAKRIAAERVRLQKELRSVRSELAELTGEGLDLADIVVGGDGRGSGVKGRGIDLRNGNLTQDKLNYHRDIKANRLQKIEWPDDVPTTSRFTQWVFVPDGREKVQVAFKQEVSNVPATSSHFWDAIRNGSLSGQVNTTLNGIDYNSQGHSLLGLHANGGVTFDLKRIRDVNGYSDLRFVSVIGFGAGPDAAATRADFMVFVDTDLKFQKLQLRKNETAELDIAIPASATTLTLIATDGGDGIGNDLLFLGDARLKPESSHASLTSAQTIRLQHLRATAAKLEVKLSALPESPKVFAILNEDQPPIVNVQYRGDPESIGDEVSPGAFAWTKHASPDFGSNSLPEGERRRALAEWITHPQNPLTPRVIVNRLWHHHFGQGIVTTPSDFGFGGGRPSHTELLDWLAGELMRNGWSLKHMHRVITTSMTYRQASTIMNEKANEIDSQNRLLWRQNPRRLDAESLHDAVLAVSGKLNPERGGPGYRDFNYTEAYAPIYDYFTPIQPEFWRRSIYRFVVRTTPHVFMTTLDCPDPSNLTPSRVQTTTALQALTLSNGEFMLHQAQHLATRIENESSDSLERVRRAFELCFQRLPNATELHSAQTLASTQSTFALCRMLLNANEFVYVD